MTTKHGTVSWCAAIGALVFTATACAGSAEPADSVVSDVEPRALTTAERRTLADAEQLLVQECMRDHGFEYVIQRPPVPPPDLPFGNDSVRFAREHGLGLQRIDLAAARARDPNARYALGLSEERREAYSRALDGTTDKFVSVELPTGFVVNTSTVGCTADAGRALHGDYERWFQLRTRVEHLGSEYLPKVWQQPRVKTALVAWRRCLAAAGVRASSPGVLRSRFVDNASTTPAEKRAAVAEAVCARRTRLTAIGTALAERIRNETYRARARLVRDYQVFSVGALDRARSLDISQASQQR